MSKLSIDQRNIKSLFQDRKSDFLIPDYQRPYAWNEEKCETLWEDLFSFAFPNNNIEKFDEDDEYFLGPIVTYQNDNKKLEVIDGQQRLTSLILILTIIITICISKVINMLSVRISKRNNKREIVNAG